MNQLHVWHEPAPGYEGQGWEGWVFGIWPQRVFLGDFRTTEEMAHQDAWAFWGRHKADYTRPAPVPVPVPTDAPPPVDSSAPRQDQLNVWFQTGQASYHVLGVFVPGHPEGWVFGIGAEHIVLGGPYATECLAFHHAWQYHARHKADFIAPVPCAPPMDNPQAQAQAQAPQTPAPSPWEPASYIYIWYGPKKLWWCYGPRQPLATGTGFLTERQAYDAAVKHYAGTAHRVLNPEALTEIKVYKDATTERWHWTTGTPHRPHQPNNGYDTSYHAMDAATKYAALRKWPAPVLIDPPTPPQQETLARTSKEALRVWQTPTGWVWGVYPDSMRGWGAPAYMSEQLALDDARHFWQRHHGKYTQPESMGPMDNPQVSATQAAEPPPAPRLIYIWHEPRGWTFGLREPDQRVGYFSSTFDIANQEATYFVERAGADTYKLAPSVESSRLITPSLLVPQLERIYDSMRDWTRRINEKTSPTQYAVYKEGCTSIRVALTQMYDLAQSDCPIIEPDRLEHPVQLPTQSGGHK